MEILKKSWKVLEVGELKRVRTLFFFESEYFSYLSELIYSVCDFLSLLH